MLHEEKPPRFNNHELHQTKLSVRSVRLSRVDLKINLLWMSDQLRHSF